MRNIYISVCIVVILSILLFIASFVYLDRTKHATYYYVVRIDGTEFATIKVEKFETEDKLIFRSEYDMPFSELITEEKTRLTLDRKYTIESYLKESFANATTDLFYLENKNKLVSFVSKYGPDFAYADGIAAKNDSYIFEDDSPATYMAMMENYDFRKGRSQGFNALAVSQDPALPPIKRYVTFTSINDETLELGARHIRAENLILKTKNSPQGDVWVSKSDRSILKIEIPRKGLVITRVYAPRRLSAKGVTIKGGYLAREVTITSKSTQLSGTFTAPSSDGKFPAVLLVWGNGPQDRNYQGFFLSIADYLSRNGYCVLRFDKRGTGLSDGDISLYSYSDEGDDINAALSFLASQKEVRADKISIIAHSEGALSCLKTAANNNVVKAIIFMAPYIYPNPESGERMKLLQNTALKSKWPEDYLRSVQKTYRDTGDQLKTRGKDWVYVLGRRCFVKDMRERYEDKPSEDIEKLTCPVFILHGKEDTDVPAEVVYSMDKIFSGYEKSNCTTSYYGYLGHWFGKKMSDGVSRSHYEVDGGILDGIKAWLDKNMPDIIVKPPEVPEK